MATLIIIAILGLLIGGFDCIITRKRNKEEYQEYLSQKARLEEQFAAQVVANRSEINAEE